MGDSEIFLEICYEKAKFNPINTLHALSSFTELVDGLNTDIVAKEIPNWSNRENISLERASIMTIQERLAQGDLEFRVLFYFPENQELINALAEGYGKSYQEAKTYSRKSNVLLGYGTICISLDETTAIVRIYPDIDILANIIMKTLVIRSCLSEFCQFTKALSARWENFDDEVLLTIWSNKVALLAE